MKTDLKFEALQSLEAELLVVLAADASTSKDKNATAEPVLLTKDATVIGADKPALKSGEFSATACETLLLHAPADLKAKRLLIVGVGKAAKLSLSEIRKAAGVAVRFAKPRKIRQVTFVLPEYGGLDLAEAARAAVEGAFVGDFDPDTYKSDRKDRSIEQFSVIAPASADKKSVEAGIPRRRNPGRVAKLYPRTGQRAGKSPDADSSGRARRGHVQSAGIAVRGVQHRQNQRAEDGRILGRRAGIG